MYKEAFSQIARWRLLALVKNHNIIKDARRGNLGAWKRGGFGIPTSEMFPSFSRVPII